MALYEVVRTDDVQPGEFVNALVIAHGARQARNAVRHLEGVTASNVLAAPVDVSSRDVAPRLMTTYHDEREPQAPELPFEPFDQGGSVPML
jgi:hypothetical protein